jgi:hypothetical protein
VVSLSRLFTNDSSARTRSDRNRHSGERSSQPHQRVGDRRRRSRQGVHLKRWQHVSEYRRRIPEPDVHRLDPACIAGKQIAHTVGHRRETGQDHWPNRGVQRKTGNSDKCRLSARRITSDELHGLRCHHIFYCASPPLISCRLNNLRQEKKNRELFHGGISVKPLRNMKVPRGPFEHSN